MRTTAAVVPAQGHDFVLREVELDEPRADEVLVRIVATGLCHLDISSRETLPAEMFPRVFGHEGAGVVEQVGADVAGIEVGDHVLLGFRSCRACGPCREGAVAYCDHALALNHTGVRPDGSTTHRLLDDDVDGTTPLFGSFLGQSSLAQHALAHADNCVVVDWSLDLTLVAPYGCAFQTGAGTVLDVLGPAPDEPMVVVGVGAVGLAAVVAARATGVRTVVAVDLDDRRLAAAERFGAVRVNPAYLGEQSVPDRVRELTGGGAAHAVDTTAVPAAVRDAQLALRPRGTLVALGLGTDDYAIDAVDLRQHGKVVRSSVHGDADPLEILPRLLRLRAEGRFEVDHLLTRYPIAQVNAAVSDVLAGEVIQPVLVW
ncbi:NAD(P)-dependent alcohol dehydrogenase [Nocardioides sp. C4-1]|uniref:NAD(P)-dependent alcohol dehydrogenase n=1 Tax=Nocardioides sp. C4-1 TaxID=3151851 RepID=UPI0032634C30